MSSTSISFKNIFWGVITVISVISVILVGKLFIASFTMAIFFYYSSRPVYKKLNSFLNQPTISAVTTMLMTFIPLLLFTGYIFKLGYNELQIFLKQYDILIRNFISNSIESNITFLFNTPTEIIQSQEGMAMIQELIDWLIIVLSFVGNIFLKILVTAIVLYYLLKHDHRLKNWATKNFSSLTDDWDNFWSRVDEDLYRIYFGNILNGIVTVAIGIIIAVVYSFFAPDIISIPFPILFGIVAGISSLIPFIGVKLAYGPVSLWFIYVALKNDPAQLIPYILIFILASIIILDFLQDIILRPYISGKHLHVGVLLISYISGPILLGWYGFFFAPIALVLIFHFTDLILPKLIESWN